MRWLILLSFLAQTQVADAAISKEKMLKLLNEKACRDASHTIRTDAKGNTTVELSWHLLKGVNQSPEKRLIFNRAGVLVETHTRYVAPNGRRLAQWTSFAKGKTEMTRKEFLGGELQRIDRYPGDELNGPQRFDVGAGSIAPLVDHVMAYVRRTGKPAIFDWSTTGRTRIVIEPSQLRGKSDTAARKTILKLAGYDEQDTKRFIRSWAYLGK